MMEFHWNNEPKVATNIFELGLKHFSREPAFVLQYLNYLIMTNNPNSEFSSSGWQCRELTPAFDYRCPRPI